MTGCRGSTSWCFASAAEPDGSAPCEAQHLRLTRLGAMRSETGALPGGFAQMLPEMRGAAAALAQQGWTDQRRARSTQSPASRVARTGSPSRNAQSSQEPRPPFPNGATPSRSRTRPASDSPGHDHRCTHHRFSSTCAMRRAARAAPSVSTARYPTGLCIAASAWSARDLGVNEA